MEKQIGAQLFTVRDFMGNIADFEATCKKLSAIGYKVVQVSGTGLPAAEMRKVLDCYGLRATATHQGFDTFVNEPQKVIEYNKTLGSTYCGIGIMPAEYRASADTLSDFIEKANRAIEIIEDGELKVAYHNHAFEFIKVDGKTIMDRLMNESNLKFIIDTYWVQVAGLNPASHIRKAGEKAGIIHFKDVCVDPEKLTLPRMCEVGEGNLDWDEIIRACDESAAGWAFVEQDWCFDRDPFDCLKISYDNMTKKGFC